MTSPNNFDIKIIDFGYAKTFDQAQAMNEAIFSTFGIGVEIVQPPEMFDPSITQYDGRVDVWYIGIMTMILYSKDIKKITEDKKMWSLRTDLGMDEGKRRVNLHDISLEGIRFINRLLRYDYQKRP